jgi:hypothetical protein
MTCVNGFRGLRNPPKRIAVERTNLTAKERALLPDPQWVTEDDADAIMSMREEKKAAGRSYSLEQVLRELALPWNVRILPGAHRQLRRSEKRPFDAVLTRRLFPGHNTFFFDNKAVTRSLSSLMV